MRDNGQNPNRGGAMLRVLVMPKRDADEGDHTHTLLLAEAPQREGDR
jgi:hypothetical protein